MYSRVIDTRVTRRSVPLASFPSLVLPHHLSRQLRVTPLGWNVSPKSEFDLNRLYSESRFRPPNLPHLNLRGGHLWDPLALTSPLLLVRSQTPESRWTRPVFKTSRWLKPGSFSFRVTTTLPPRVKRTLPSESNDLTYFSKRVIHILGLPTY